jgi:hypothetical protein
MTGLTHLAALLISELSLRWLLVVTKEIKKKKRFILKPTIAVRLKSVIEATLN